MSAAAKDMDRLETRQRFKPYPAYKDSGVEWLGDIPGGWQALKLKRVCSFAYGDSLATDSRADGAVEVYGSNGPVGSHDQANTLAPCLVIGRKGSFGKINFSVHVVFAIDTTFFVDRRLTRADLRWLYYALSDAQLDSATKDSAIPGLDREDAYARVLFLPPGCEQRAIAAFLDRETARIDALVAKKERLIELLQEKRTALITRAVTKGLDPNAPMQDSGVEWLGEIPAHWRTDRLGRLSKVGNGSTPARDEPRYWFEGSAPWLTSGKINEGVISSADEFVTSAALRECHLPKVSAGSVLVAITGEGQTRGRAALLTFDATISQHLAYIRPDDTSMCPRYLRRVLQSRYEWLRSESSGAGSTRAALTCEFIRSIEIPILPAVEQDAIATFLDRATARIDALVAKVREAIDRLTELRTALISAAVTGKIDVREEVA